LNLLPTYLKVTGKNTHFVKLCSKPLLPVQPKFNEAPTLRKGKDALDYFAKFQQVMFPNGFRSKNDFYDVMHISIPYLFSRDIFLTRNWHDFRADKLQEKFSDLVILTPQQLINVLNDAMRIF